EAAQFLDRRRWVIHDGSRPRGGRDARYRIAAARIDQRGAASGEHTLVGVAADDDDAAHAGPERKQIAVVLEQDRALLFIGLAHRLVGREIDRSACRNWIVDDS